MSRTFNCEICGRKIDETHRTLSTEFPMIYSGEITVCGDLCSGCKKEVKDEFGRIVKRMRQMAGFKETKKEKTA